MTQGRESNKASGRRAEDTALRFLQRQGLALLSRNFTCRRGELDLVMQEAETIVFVEVRFRRSTAFGDPAETVDARKQQRLVAAARYYLKRHGMETAACRFDVVCVTGNPGSGQLRWLRDAIQA